MSNPHAKLVPAPTPAAGLCVSDIGGGPLYARRVERVAAACAFLALVVALVLSRAPGPAVSPDAASYLCASEFLARGQAPRVPFAEWNDADSTTPLQHFPPGFPAVVALPVAAGVPSVQAARWVEVFAFAATALLVALVAGSVAGPFAAALAGVMVTLTPAIASTHAMVLSEPLFLALLALLLLVMVRAPQRALLLGVIAAAALLVRYAGAALVAAAALHSAWQPGRLGARLRRACLAGAPGLIALGSWRYFAGAFREYGYQAGVASQIGDAWQTIAAWLVPLPEPSGLRSALATVVGVAIALACSIGVERPVRDDAGTKPSLLALRRATLVLGVCYIGIVVGSRLFADPDIPFDWRMLSPLALLLETLLAAVVVAGWQRPAPIARAVTTPALALWLLASSWSLAQLTLRPHPEQDPNSPRARLTRWLQTEGSHYTLYSDDPTVIWNLAHRSSRLLPRAADPSTLRSFAAALAQKPSAVLGLQYRLMETVAASELADRLAFRPLARFGKVSVWVYEDRPTRDRSGEASR
jgi:hypothetical protein